MSNTANRTERVARNLLHTASLVQNYAHKHCLSTRSLAVLDLIDHLGPEAYAKTLAVDLRTNRGCLHGACERLARLGLIRRHKLPGKPIRYSLTERGRLELDYFRKYAAVLYS